MKRLLIVVFVLVPHLIKEYFKWILPYAQHKERYPYALRFFKVQQIIKYVVDRLGLNIDNTSFNDLYKEKKSFVLMCNHQSDFDPLLIIYFAKRPITFLAKKEVKKFMFIGKIIYLLDGAAIDRNDLKSQIKILLNVEKSIAENKSDWVIFPEGTRNKNPETDNLLDFHAGSFKIVLKSKCSLGVITTYGTYRVLHFLDYLKQGLPVSCSKLKIYTKETYINKTSTELCDNVHDFMEDEIIKLKEIDKTKMKKIGYK